MERNIVISVKDLKKTFRLPHERSTSLKQALVNTVRGKAGYTEFEVLKGIDFEVYEGEFFGIIGRNGSGKSTLLKMLAGIYVPNGGSIKINGQISPFLELGVGFNPELTGYENIYLNGAILGLSRKEIDEKMGEIIEFSELGEFMDQKLKNYSSGMQVRLAFSVAIHAHAPIILLDEVLAVGDTNFQQKCFKVFHDLKRQGKTIVFVSHSMESIQRFCDRAMLIHKGLVRLIGKPGEVAFEYEKLNVPSFMRDEVKKDALNEKFEVTKTYLSKITGGDIKALKTGDDFMIKIEYVSNYKEDLKVDFTATFYKDEIKCFETSSFSDGKEIIAKKGKKGALSFTVKKLGLLAGEYRFGLVISGTEAGFKYYNNPNCFYFNVVNKSLKKGICDFDYEWTIL